MNVINTTKLIIVVLTLAVSACVAPNHRSAAGQLQGKDLGIRSSHWGDLHEYIPAGPPRWQRGTARPLYPKSDGTTVLDLLVGPDGVVRDIVVAESSGDQAVDDAARARFVGAAFPVIPGYTHSEPYVVRVPVTLKGGAAIPQPSVWQ